MTRASAAGAPASIAVVGIAASTGGPAALALLLRAMPADFPAGIAIVQHLTPGFVDALARWMAPLCDLRVSVAKDGDLCTAGAVLFAPDARHLTIDRGGRARLSEGPHGTLHRPSADVLFESIAENFGPRSAGVVLTGMGDDGARGLLAMHRAGAPTLAQDEASCVVPSMPLSAARSGAAPRSVPLLDLGAALCHVVGWHGGASPP